MTEKNKSTQLLTVEDIKKIIPHRYPFLLIDRITEVRDGYVKGYKNVSINEPFFQGHFPEVPIMPGVLIVEALAQISCVCEMIKEENKGRIGIFVGIDQVKFKKPVFPGDKLDLEASLLWMRRGVGKCQAKASVNGEICCSGELAFALVDKKEIK